LLKYGLSAPLFISMLIISSAAISKSNAAMLFDSKLLFNTSIRSTSLKLVLPARAVNYKGQMINLKGDAKGKQSEKNKAEKAITINMDTIPAKNDGPIFTAVEKAPEFKSGIPAFYRFLGQNIRYPEAMRKKNIQGKVFITFIVEKDGSLSDIKSVRDVGYGSAEESIRVLKLSPKWSPGYQNGVPVRVQYTMPINFTMENTKTTKDTSQKTGDASPKTYKVEYSPAKMFYTVTKDSGKNSPAPLFILDGKEVAQLNNVAPSDIESINVLKQDRDDNSLVLLYGAKAVNGVVLVKTKKAAAKTNSVH